MWLRECPCTPKAALSPTLGLVQPPRGTERHLGTPEETGVHPGKRRPQQVQPVLPPPRHGEGGQRRARVGAEPGCHISLCYKKIKKT